MTDRNISSEPSLLMSDYVNFAGTANESVNVTVNVDKDFDIVIYALSPYIGNVAINPTFNILDNSSQRYVFLNRAPFSSVFPFTYNAGPYAISQRYILPTPIIFRAKTTLEIQYVNNTTEVSSGGGYTGVLFHIIKLYEKGQALQEVLDRLRFINLV